jgi:DNA-binding beta-propeller fold protein YncE
MRQILPTTLKLQLLILCGTFGGCESGCSCNSREAAAQATLTAQQSAHTYCCDPEQPDPPEGYPGCDVTFAWRRDLDAGVGDDPLLVTPVPNLDVIVDPQSFPVGPLSPQTISLRIRHCVDSVSQVFEISVAPPGSPTHDVMVTRTITLVRECPPPGGGGTGPVTTAVLGLEGLLRMRPAFAETGPGDTALPLPPHSIDIVLAGDNGWAIVEPETGATVNGKGLELGFASFGVLPLSLTPSLSGSGNIDDTAFAFGPLNGHLTEYIPASDEFGPTLIVAPGSSHTDGSLYADGTSDGGVFVNFTFGTVRFLQHNPSGFFEVATDFISDAAYGIDPGNAITACADSPTSPVYVVTEGSPGSLYVHLPADRPHGAATRIGSTGNAPRRVRKDGNHVVVSNHESDSLTVTLADTNMIVGTVPVGDGPVGIELMRLGSGNLAVASTGFNDHTFTITVLDPAGAVVSNETKPLPAGCTGPGHVIFWKSGVLVSCKTSNNLIYVEVPELVE